MTEFALGFVIVRVTSNTLAAYIPNFDRLRQAVETVRKAKLSTWTRARAISVADQARRLASIIDRSPQ